MDYEGLSKTLDLATLPDPADKYVLEELIAEGAFGAVYRASDKCKRESLAVDLFELVVYFYYFLYYHIC